LRNNRTAVASKSNRSCNRRITEVVNSMGMQMLYLVRYACHGANDVTVARMMLQWSRRRTRTKTTTTTTSTITQSHGSARAL